MAAGSRPTWGASPLTRRLAALVLAAGLAACSSGEGKGADLAGTTLHVVAVWQGPEAAAFEQVLAGFTTETGLAVEFTSTAGQDIGAVIDDRLGAGDPPDVAMLPQPGLLSRYAAEGAIVPLADDVAGDVRAHYATVWQRLGSVDGRLYGVWFKAANKSLVWYSLGAFEAAGVVPPAALDRFAAVAGKLSAAGTPAFAVPTLPSDAWTLTDWFENLYLRMAGPDRYDALAERRLPWTDPTVRATLTAMARLLAPGNVAWTTGADTSFPAAVAAVFSTTPAAAMVVEGDFVPGVIAAPTPVELGVDVDVFAFPESTSGERFVVGGGDVAVLMRPSEAGQRLVRYLGSVEAAEIWARLGGFITPNEDLDLSAYPDETTRRVGRAVIEAGDRFRFDLSDLQPAAFGGTTGAGLWGLLHDFVFGGVDVDTTMARLEAAARAAWGDAPVSGG